MIKDRILVFIPMYNCEPQITRVLNQFNEEVSDYIEEVIIVNNRSTDKGEETAINYAKQMKNVKVNVLRNDNNYGLGGSHKVAFNYALDNRFDYVIVLHGDDQGNIHDILPLLKSKDYQNYDCCLGARFMKGSKLSGYSKFRTFGNRVYNWVFTLATKKRIYDLGAGLNLYKTKMLKSRFYLKFSDNLMFNCYMLLANATYKFNVKFLPITWREDDQVSNVRLFSQAFRTLKIALFYFLSFRKHEFLEKDFRDNTQINDYTAKVINK
ncbi:glycosyltransferase family 2 protein [Paenibacillus hunanensis]|uniref:Glycosyltransferase involved in cell wall biosynthesis n=1 Tax=Paenibacillus hunanensis TaxID=539262 RepID=A0ABU1IUG1_9BACL|nr:glycosyltransferase family 2 protein [Paenibacillus hunanensis]MDR6242551.1 glycosyltransferase involved in cell wall biosynthesis [Paenibacillus hunanensis]GGJ00927.1 hypothetical protein GCM10008022_07280 [Paenibacillus hunanensis]